MCNTLLNTIRLTPFPWKQTPTQLTDITIRIAVQPWHTSNPESHKLFALIVNRFGHISQWDTSCVTNMADLFDGAELFNYDISKWNVSRVTNMTFMFYCAFSFNQNISQWNTASVTNMSGMFSGATRFNQNISAWNVAKVANMNGMFFDAMRFNQNISAWNVAKSTDISGMFYDATVFNKTLCRYKLNNPFNAPSTHSYHNWTRRKAFIKLQTKCIKKIQLIKCKL
jgi:surface protein